MHKIYNLIVVRANKQLQEKVALDATFQEDNQSYNLMGT